MDWTQIICTALEMLIPALLSVLGLLIYKWAKNKGANAEALALISEAYTIFQKCVLSVNQTYVDALKASGKFDETAQATARTKCKEQFESLINDEMAVAINAIYGSVDKWINTVREADVREAKTAA